MIKASLFFNVILLYLGSKLFRLFGEGLITPFVMLETYFFLSLFSFFLVSKDLFNKSISLYLSIFWLINAVTDFFFIDSYMIITLLGSIPLYVIIAKNIIKPPKTKIDMDFKQEAYIFHHLPSKWYHWIWVLFGNDLEARKTIYYPKKGVYFYNTSIGLKEHKCNNELAIKLMSNCNVSIGQVSYKELHNKVGHKINCKKDIY